MAAAPPIGLGEPAPKFSGLSGRANPFLRRPHLGPREATASAPRPVRAAIFVAMQTKKFPISVRSDISRQGRAGKRAPSVPLSVKVHDRPSVPTSANHRPTMGAPACRRLWTHRPP